MGTGPQHWSLETLLSALSSARTQEDIHAVIERYCRDHIVLRGPYLTHPRAIGVLAQLLRDTLHWAVRVKELPPEQRIMWQAILSERCGPELRRAL